MNYNKIIEMYLYFINYTVYLYKILEKNILHNVTTLLEVWNLNDR